MKSEPLTDRFWRKVNKSGPVPAHCKHLGPCWIWTGAIGTSGYGCILRGLRTEGTRRSCLAHRVAYELEHGSCPSNRQVIAARRANASGVSNAKLAIRYGVSPGSMWKAVSGKTWRNV